MDIILFIFMVLVLLAEAFFFQGNMTALICGIVLCVVYVILRIVFAFVKKKAPKLIGRIICWAILFLLGISIFRLGIKGEGGGVLLYARIWIRYVHICMMRTMRRQRSVWKK